MAVLPVRIAVKIKHLRNIETVSEPGPQPSREPELIQRRMRQAADDITRDIETRLGVSYFFDVVPDSDVRKILNGRGIASATSTLTSVQAEDLGKALGAQVILCAELSGYGAIKRRWLLYLIGSGLAEGLAQGAAAAAVVGSPWAAIGIGVEEAAQETAEWAGGAFLFGRFWSPVILEGRLLSASDGQVVWRGTSLESGNRKAVRALPEEERKKREVRLRWTARRAVDKLVRKMEKKAWSNLKYAKWAAARPS